MSEIRYYTDEHVAKAVIRGLDVLTTPEANNLSMDDEDHLAFALAEGRVIFTQDDDFLKLASLGKANAGIVYAPQHTSIGEIIQGLILIYQVLEAEEMIGNIEYL